MVAAKGIKGTRAKCRDPRDAAEYLSCAGAHPSHSVVKLYYTPRGSWKELILSELTLMWQELVGGHGTFIFVALSKFFENQFLSSARCGVRHTPVTPALGRPGWED